MKELRIDGVDSSRTRNGRRLEANRSIDRNVISLSVVEIGDRLHRNDAVLSKAKARKLALWLLQASYAP